jgi:ubiquinone/menaquinone biosynthesis C-methylase UbiE
MQKLVELYCELPLAVRKPLWKVWHKLIIDFDKSKSNTFMNYGYAALDNSYDTIKLEDADKHDLYSLQLYDFVVRNLDLTGKNVLEVGSGRGGGASYITRYKKPKSYTAVDISQQVMDFCTNFHNVEGLKFVKGDAENLPFPDNSFDVIVNVESARCYPSIPNFFTQVNRLLKQDGEFRFTDMIKPKDVAGIRTMIDVAGFAIIEEINIRQNVVKALQLNSDAIKGTIDKRIPKFLRKSFYEFAGVVGSNRYAIFADGDMEYWSFILRKK